MHLYESRGIPMDLARQLADEVMSNPELALQTHAREELGVNPDALGRPVQAAVSSFVTFSAGAVVPLVPFLLGGGHTAVIAAVVAAAVASLVVGGLLSFFTGRDWWWSAARQLLICAAAGAVTFGIGSAIGVSGVTS